MIRTEGDFERLIGRIGRALEDAEVPYMVIGGQVVLLHGEPRLTQHIDITLGVDSRALPQVLEVCGTSTLEPLPEDPADFVRETFVLPAVEQETGLRADFIFSTIPYEREAIRRAVSVEVVGTTVVFATAEDLILHKLFAGRPRDLEDARGVVRRRGSGIDWSYVERWAGEFTFVPGRENLAERVRELREEGGWTDSPARLSPRERLVVLAGRTRIPVTSSRYPSIGIGNAAMKNDKPKERKEPGKAPNALALVQRHRSEILRLARSRGARNVRVFGSIVRNEDAHDSDIDFLVEMEAGRSLFDRGGLLTDLEKLLGRPVDVVSASNLRREIRDQVLAEARPL